MMQVIIAGRLTKDAVLRYTGDGTAVLGFTVATEVGYGEKKHSVYVGCSLWGKRAEALDPYLKKAKQVTVIGEGDLRNWQTDQKSGSEITCKVQELELQGGSVGTQEEEPKQQGFRDKAKHQAPVTQADFADDDIPF